ncbi:unnamed protein product [Clonostachys byssicola]|uniref:Altered inheritance of mitochondria protein 24, mitochondrial n=1 Tax=Clonostachys byssicola TaxID=160290 RepID=A0A9N9UUE3_9HYPO|nr:unnamed protein product [Clonostachys byssicola]
MAHQGPPQQGYYPPPPPGAPPGHQAQGHPQQQQFHAPQQQQHQQQHPSDSGQFPGGSYAVTHRDTNAVLNVTVQQGANVRSAPGAMIHMSGDIKLTGKVKFSMKKLFTGGEMSESTYTGPGRVALGPTLFGDIITLHIDGRQNWIIGKDAFLACTADVAKESKSQGLGKALFSGEDLFVYHVKGQGIMWLTSFGAVDRLDLQPGEQHIVDNGHLVAWSCDYKIERAGGGASTSLKTGEGLVCRFTGPGSVYVQTRNMDEFQSFIRATAGSQ